MEMLRSIPLARFQSMRRLALGVILALAAGVLLFCASPTGYHEFHEYVEAIGLALIAAAIVGRVWCTLYIGGRKAAEIVDLGPYSITRNPLYVFSAIGAAGVGAQTGSAVVGLAFGLLTVLAFLVVIRREEAHLSEHFGAQYAAYCARVPRFWPKLALFKDSETVTAPSKRVYATLLDGLVFVAAVPVFEAIEHLQEANVLPVLLRVI
nr:isoprenylcysteine carboxylmethyltransferase family protein [Mesorhizobium shangrilense]